MKEKQILFLFVWLKLKYNLSAAICDAAALSNLSGFPKNENVM